VPKQAPIHIRDTLDELSRFLSVEHQRTDLGLDLAEAEIVHLLQLDLGVLEPNALVDPYTTRDLLALLRRLDPSRFPWTPKIIGELLGSLGPLREDHVPAVTHDVEVGRRVLAAHMFLEGDAEGADFRAVEAAQDGDIQVGLGLKLSDGSLPRFLIVFARQSGHTNPILALQPYFASDAAVLAAAVEKGADVVAELLRAQITLRYDARLRRVVGSLAENWQTYFGRLAASLGARRLQLEMAAGHRLVAARQTADQSGMTSLRGLALAFDMQPLIARLGARGRLQSPNVGSEASRMHTMADLILERLDGGFANYWQARAQTLIEGRGALEGRHYLETRFLGQNAAKNPWKYSLESGLSEGDASVPVSIPVPGREYLVQSGDHLSRIARQAYGGKADYRYILSQNPQLRSPAGLHEGQKLFIPQWPPPRPKRSVVDLHRAQSKARVEGRTIRIPGRSVGPFATRTQLQCEAIAKLLSEQALESLLRTRHIRLPEGWGVWADGRILIELGESDVPDALLLFGGDEEPLGSWAKFLAAQTRGDLIMEPDHTLSFGFKAEEPHRVRWVRTALRRALTLDLEVREAAAGLLEIAERGGAEAIVQLERVDLEAIRARPGRRLTHFSLEDAANRRTLAELWLSDLRREEAEVLLAPVLDLHHYRSRIVGDEEQLLVPIGTPVFPVCRGVVRHCAPIGEAGLSLLIEHFGGLFSRITHLASSAVRVGEGVEADKAIARAGMSGETREPCVGLELELRPEDADRRAWRVPSSSPRPAAALFGRLFKGR